MPVRSKTKPTPVIEVVRLEQSTALQACVLMNRVRHFLEANIDLAEFFTFMPVACYDCRRVLPIAKLRIGPDLFIRCVDTTSCRKDRGQGAAEESTPRPTPQPSAAPSTKSLGKDKVVGSKPVPANEELPDHLAPKPKFKSKGK